MRNLKSYAIGNRKAICCESSNKTQPAENSKKKNKAQAKANLKPQKDDVQNDAQDEKLKLKKNLVGLALSGGGIRSATFSLGVLQRLAKEGYLKHVDYLSTVSGGGYIGGSLTWLLSNKAKKLKKDGICWNTSANLPYGVEDPRKERRRKNESNILKHLRLHGKYLIPGNGVTMLSFITVILRGILLNLLVWLPMVVVLMVVLMLVAQANWEDLWGDKAVYLMTVLMLVSWASWDIKNIGSIIKNICFMIVFMVVAWASRDDLWNDVKAVSHLLESNWWSTLWSDIKAVCWACTEGELNLLLCLAGLMGIGFLLASISYSLSTRKLILKLLKLLKDPYLCRRIFEKWIPWPLFIGLGLLVMGSFPKVVGWLKNFGPLAVCICICSSIMDSNANGTGSIAPLLLLLGIVGGLWSFYRSGHNEKGKIPLGVLAPIASILFLYGLVLGSYWFVSSYFDTSWFNGVLLVGEVISLVTGWYVNLNYISIHRYYRDRLMEAFMPCPNTDGKPTAAIKADKAELSDMWSKHAPYHLINTNVILVNSNDSRWWVRGGDAFLLSPKYCGSTATGWRKTACYMQKDPLTLATAVAISGAAANPNTGAGGSGPTRKPLLSLLMSLLNVRLGYWVPHPNPDKSKFQKVGNHFRAAYHELSSRGYAEHQKLLQISDGGHFENLGVYELVRRKVKLIICCDGSTDPEFNFTDLQVLVRRIGTDFGAKIKFNKDNYLERIIPRDPDPQKVIDRDPNTDAYPIGIKFAERGYIKGKIIYRDRSKGTLILLKTTMIKGLGIRLKGYKGAHPDFPDQSTADQFFDEDQFEAYRELGYEIARRMIKDSRINLQGLLRKCR